MTRRSLVCTASICFASLAFGGSVPHSSQAAETVHYVPIVKFSTPAPTVSEAPASCACNCEVPHDVLFEQILTDPDTVALAMPRMEYIEPD